MTPEHEARVAKATAALRQKEVETMLRRLSECLYEAAKAAHEAEEWTKRAEVYRKALSEIAVAGGEGRA